MSKKFTIEEVKNFIEIESESGCKLLSDEYIDKNTKLHIRCKCGETFLATYNNFRHHSKRQCNKCSANSMSITLRKSDVEFKKEFYDSVQNEYTLLSEYKNNHTKIKIRHNSDLCNHYEFYMTPALFLRGSRCPYCKNKIKMTTEEYKKRVYNIYEDEYTVLGEYINNNKKIRIRHNCEKCNNYEWNVTPYSIISGHGCPKCTNNMQKTTESFKEEIINKFGDNYEILSEYKTCHDKITIRHKACNNKFETTPSVFLQGIGCSICSGNYKHTDTNWFKERVYGLTGDEYSVLGKYQNAKTKIQMLHNKCNNNYYVAPSDFMYSKQRCPYCAESKGEQKLRAYLSTYDISYESQYNKLSLKGLGGGLLRFDFAIFYDIEKTNLQCLIEYDGIFHYEKQYDDDGFEVLQYHDQLKNEYCEKHNIRLIRIPYWDFLNIEQILIQEGIIPNLQPQAI